MGFTIGWAGRRWGDKAGVPEHPIEERSGVDAHLEEGGGRVLLDGQRRECNYFLDTGWSESLEASLGQGDRIGPCLGKAGVIKSSCEYIFLCVCVYI